MQLNINCKLSARLHKCSVSCRFIMTILEKLSDERVVYFELNEEKTQMNVMEGCDLWFSVDLTKQEVKQLIEELTALYGMMSENGS